MAIKNATTGGNPNPLSYNDIKTEFGNPTGNKLGNYRVSEDYGDLDNLPLDTGIPQGNSPIKFSHFYGKQANIVVDLYSNVYGNGTNSNTSANFDVYTGAFNNGRYDVVGNKSGTDRTSIPKSGWQGGKKVIIHINKHFGSAGASDKDDVAIRTGNNNNNNNSAGWPNSTDLFVDVGDNGRVYGKGGNGGRGANSNNNVATAGGKGSSAMKIISGTIVNGEAITESSNSPTNRIVAGGGGGGGGAGGEQDDWRDPNSAGGGGGGGGRGFPAGNGGEGGSGRDSGSNGEAGEKNRGGNPGEGGDDEEAQGGDGGEGGEILGANSTSDGQAGADSPRGPTDDNSHNGGEGGRQFIFY